MSALTLPSLNITYWILQTIAMMVTAFLIPNLTVRGPLGALITVVALAFINSTIWDAALFFEIPNSFTSHALLLVLTNGVIFYILVKVLPGIEVKGILPALVAPIVFTVCSLLIHTYGSQIDWTKVFAFAAEQVRMIRGYFGAPVSSQ